MKGGETTGRWRGVVRYAFGSALCLVAFLDIALGAQWFLGLGVLAIGVLIILGRRRIFRPGVRRVADEVICQYVPWYEGNAYFLNVGLPVLGVTCLAGSFAPGFPVWSRFIGIMLLALTPIGTYASWRMWRRCVLCFAPKVLRLRTAERGDVLTDIPRGRLHEVVPKLIPNSVNGVKSLQVEISYSTADMSSDVKTATLGLQLTVEPQNLLDALVAWRDHPGDDPAELMDRIEHILVGRS
jgi:hypothetical protein